MYAPMLVFEVCGTREPSAFRMSVGRPLASSVIATKELQVACA
jgi:hypothetical protein